MGRIPERLQDPAIVTTLRTAGLLPGREIRVYPATSAGVSVDVAGLASAVHQDTAGSVVVTSLTGSG